MSICYEDTKFKKGDCDFCKTRYNKVKITDYGWDEYNPPGTATEYQACPKCHYNPEIAGDIKHILGVRTKVTMSYNTNSENKPEVSTNYEELTDLIVKLMKKSWPKPKKGGKKK